ncbi:Zn-dependent metalloprotease [Hathewaya proteolytica DSM 3090]|uniref:Zn-dependent metalloprotease n=1 Tax=Hathewaya proteolytica DSM 3090 TaxID=1121331 RepID=A0A1M6KDU6_9CLOT|nr:M4 family metallopeptidase [Hathewaya proteolytica]SHJ57126.1 Zn-dependent metalloprotease [Hathewaya proteolytica DSM 3090]
MYNGAWENYDNGYSKCEDGSYLITNNGVNANIEVGASIKVSYIFKTQDEVVDPEHILVLYDNMGKVIDPLEDDFKYLRIGYNPGDCDSAVTQDVMLVESGQYGSDIEWTSSDEQIIDLSGKVNRPSSEPKSVQLTAKLTYEGRTLVKEFAVTVMNTRNFDPSNVKDLSVDDLAEMNSGYDNYNIEISEFGYITNISGSYSDIKVDSYETALYSLYSLKTAMGISNPFEELKSTSVKSNKKGSIYKFNQVYNGIEVYGKTVVLSVDPQGKTRYLRSNYFPINKDINVIPKTTYEEALKSVEEKYIGAQAYGDEDESKRLYISNYYGKVELVWKVYFDLLEDNGDLNKGEYRALVSAINDDVIYKTCTTQYDSNIEVKGTDLNNKERTFNIIENTHWFSNKVEYMLEDMKRNIRICDAHGAEIFKNDIYQSSSKNEWTEEQISAMANMKDIYEYYLNTFDRISYDDAWTKITGNNIRIYLNTGIENNAYWDSTRKLIAMGKGDGDRFKEISLAAAEDVLCHEFTHAIVGYETNLGEINKGLPGIINEAYADIFACFYDSNKKGYKDWIVGEDICSGKGIRDVSDPNSLGDCAEFNGKYFQDYSNPEYYTKGNDFGGVHQNSTIISHAAYLMYKNGIGFERLQSLWYESLCLGYEVHSDFWDVRVNVIQAAKNLGFSKAEIGIIEQSFKQVNVTEDCNETYKSYFKRLDKISITQDYFCNSIKLNGKVVTADLDTIIGNNKGIKDVNINVYSFNKTEKYGYTSTEDSGIYISQIKLEDKYLINFDKEGYVSEKMYLSDIDSIFKSEYYCGTVALVPKEYEGMGGARGKVISASTGLGVGGVTLNVRRGINNIYTDITKTIKTDDNGEYIIDSLESGNYCVEIVDEVKNGDEYLSTFINIKVLGGHLIREQNGVISSSLERNQIRVVLSWGDTPRDLDSHMLCSLLNTLAGHVDYRNKSFYNENNLVCMLDLDDTSGYGPETTTIYHSEVGMYTFYVYNYSGEENINRSQATVSVYMNGAATPVYTFNIPTGDGRFWTVFRYNGATKIIIPINLVENNTINEER